MSIKRKERNKAYQYDVQCEKYNIIHDFQEGSLSLLLRNRKKEVTGITNENTDISLSRLTIAYFSSDCLRDKVQGIDAEWTMRDEI